MSTPPCRRAAALALLAAGLAAAPVPCPARAAEPIRIGVAVPLSGDLASYGIPSSRAAELVVK
jgi:branched-chain amino acid transport system substrate-binding protein